MTLALDIRPTSRLARLRHDAPAMTWLALVLAATVPALLLAQALDPRLVDGEGAWLKPMRFALSLSLYAGTLAWAARYVPSHLRTSRRFRLATGIVIAAIALETMWLTAAATLGIRSHYNVTEPLFVALYPLAGLVAVTLTAGSLVWGLAILSGRPAAFERLLGWSLVATFVLTVPIAGTMSGIEGGIVAGTGAPRIPFLDWSLRGDLHPAHFLATHTLQAVPLIARATRPTLWLVPAWSALTLAAFGWAFV